MEEREFAQIEDEQGDNWGRGMTIRDETELGKPAVEISGIERKATETRASLTAVA
jgi:hypothetical protein